MFLRKKIKPFVFIFVFSISFYCQVFGCQASEITHSPLLCSVANLSEDSWSENILKAIEFDDLDLVIELLEQFPEAKKSPDSLACLMIMAGKRNCLDIAEKLIEMGADVNSKKFYGEFPLVIAITENNLDWVRLLLSSGVNVDLELGDGISPLFFATSRGASDITIELLNSEKFLIDEEGPLALFVAAHLGNLKIIKALLEAGCDVDEKDADGLTAKDYALMSGQKEAATLLDAYSQKNRPSPQKKMVEPSNNAASWITAQNCALCVFVAFIVGVPLIKILIDFS